MIRATRLMDYDSALDYQVRAQEALMFIDETRGRQEAMRQFLDDKTVKPGLGAYDKTVKPGLGAYDETVKPGLGAYDKSRLGDAD